MLWPSFRYIRPIAIALITALTYVSLNAAFAAELPILTITNDEDNDTTLFVLDTDEDGIMIEGFLKDTFSRKGTKKGRFEYDMESIYEDGLIIEERKGHIVAKLVSQNFDPKLGGDITIDTLYNGVKGKRKKYQIQLAHNGEKWIVTSKKKEVTHMHMKSKKVFLIGTVGIENIIMSKK